jgi:hypothetical protein
MKKFLFYSPLVVTLRYTSLRSALRASGLTHTSLVCKKKSSPLVVSARRSLGEAGCIEPCGLKSAFVLPVVLALATVVGMLLVACWWVTSLQVDIVSQREQWYNNLYATERVLNDGLVTVQKEFDRMAKRLAVAKAPLVWEATEANVADGGPRVTGTVVVSLPKAGKGSAVITDQLVVQVTARVADRLAGVVRCLLTKVVRSTGKGKEIRFVVSHFTLGYSV